MARSPLPLAALLLAAALLTSCTRESPDTNRPVAAPSPTGAAGPVPTATVGGPTCIETVYIKDGKPTPEALTVRRNCVVLFSNQDDAVIQIQGHDFLLGEMGKGQSWAHTYKDAGSFEYRDAKGSGLAGRVIVQP